MAQDDYYYEIQLTNKQLVFYFLAGATGLILSFLAGVMVGRGVDSSGADVQAARPVREERVVAEEAPKPAAPPSPADLTYAQRLEAEKTEDSLERPKAGAAAARARGQERARPRREDAGCAPPPPRPRRSSPKRPPEPRCRRPRPRPFRPAAESKPVAKTIPKPDTPVSDAASAGTGRSPSRSARSRTRPPRTPWSRGSRARASRPTSCRPGATEGGLFIVRVGSYPPRADAERVEAKLRDEEKFKPFIVKN